MYTCLQHIDGLYSHFLLCLVSHTLNPTLAGNASRATLAMVRAKVMMGELRSINPDEPDIKPALQPASAPV